MRQIVLSSIIFFLFSLMSPFSVDAQFGLRIKYNVNDLSGLDQDLSINSDGGKTLESSIELGADYWFRLKKYRWEFLPELSFSYGSSEIPENQSITQSAFNFYINNNIYIFDFGNDCDCPTFSKDGNAFTKGIHFIVTPGVSIYNTSFNENGASSFSPSVALGLGYDIGLDNLITISPFLLYRRAFSISVQDAFPDETLTGDPYGLSQFQLGIRVGFRPDYSRSFGRR